MAVRYRAFLVALTAGTALLATAPSMAANSSRCERPKAATVEKTTRTVTIYRRSTSRGDGKHRTWWACYRSTGRRTVIYRGGTLESRSQQASKFRTAGAYTAFMTTESIKSAATRTLVLFNARSGERVDRIDIPDSNEPIAFSLRQLVLAKSGVLAWLITRNNRVAPEPRHDTLQVRDRAGVRVLDTGAPSTLANVKITTSTVNWTHAEAPRSAQVSAGA